MSASFDGAVAPPYRLEGETHTVGRGRDADWNVSNPGISRRHACIERSGSEWLISDLGSLQGTYVNGRRVEIGEKLPLRAWDSVALGSWVFRCEPEGATSTGKLSADDTMTQGHVTPVPADEMAGGQKARLDVILSITRELAQQSTRADVARVLTRSVAAGTGCGRALVLRKRGENEYDVIASRSKEDDVALSQSLLREAEKGVLVQLVSDALANRSHSIIDLNIRTAICAPLVVGGVVDSFLYVDTRGTEQQLASDTTSFCRALSDLGSLAIERLLATEMSNRRALLERDVAEAREAQELLLPSRSGAGMSMTYAFECLPGRHVAGDLFDVVEVPGGRTAFFLGDVSGKGVGAGVLMVASQTKLGALLGAGVGLAEAIGLLNSYVLDRTDSGRFVTLLVAVWDPSEGVLELLDAGHGYCCLRAPGEAPAPLPQGGNPPVGVIPGLAFKSRELRLERGTRMVMFSDGVVEQQDERGSEFGLAAALEAIGDATSVEEDVSALVAGVKGHATGALADDLTVASIELG